MSDEVKVTKADVTRMNRARIKTIDAEIDAIFEAAEQAAADLKAERKTLEILTEGEPAPGRPKGSTRKAKEIPPEVDSGQERTLSISDPVGGIDTASLFPGLYRVQRSGATESVRTGQEAAQGKD